MAGVKGKTNNPNGRPVGAKNKLQLTVKGRIIDYVNNDFDTFIKEVKKLRIKDRVKAKLELIKLVTPRPLNEEERNALNNMNPLLTRLFGKSEEEK